MRPTATPYVTFIYGVVIIMLGYLEWRNVGSLALFMIGSGGGFLTLIASLLMIRRRKWADWAALALVFILLVVFGIEFYMTHNFMPAAVTLFSALLTVLILMRALQKQE